MDNYYFDGECFKLRSKIPAKIRLVLSILLLVVSLTFVEQTAYSNSAKGEWQSEYIEVIQDINNKVSYKDAKEITFATLKWAKEFEVDEKLLLAIMKVESTFDKYAISTSGAYGLMQVIPVWHKDKILKAKKELGNPELFDINTNIYLGAWIVHDCFIKSRGNLQSALLCYSGQTPDYDKKVLYAYKALKIST